MCLEPSIEPQSYLSIAIKYRAKMSSFDQKCTFKEKHTFKIENSLNYKYNYEMRNTLTIDAANVGGTSILIGGVRPS